MKQHKHVFFYSCVIVLFVLMVSCESEKEDKYVWKCIDVTATAYNSVPSQTDGTPNIAAWGDTLVEGMKCIAVSRDLLRLGIEHNTPVKIEGLEGIYLVKDKMNKKYRGKIDIYMGNDVKKAKEWGRKKLSIHYGIPKDKLKNKQPIK